MATGALHRLKDTPYRVPNSRSDIRRHDIRGHKVVDEAGEELGTVDDLLVDDLDQTIRLIEVEAGGLLGLGRDRVLLPLEAVREIRGEVVREPQPSAGHRRPGLRSGSGEAAAPDPPLLVLRLPVAALECA